METLSSERVDLNLSESAAAQLKRLMARDGRSGHALRIAVADGGCSGYSYKLDFDERRRPEDIVLERGGVTIYIDRASAPYLAGTVIDFVESLQGAGFKFNNPKAKSTCGCGSSFSA